MSELDNIQEISETAFHTPATGVTPPPPVPVTVTSASTSPTESTSVPAGVTEPTSTPSPQPNLLSPVPQRVVRSVSPDIRAATPLEHQVAGHAGVMADESGELVIKPALPREIAFYQLVSNTSRNEPLGKLRPFLPKFLGTLRLEGRQEEGGRVVAIDGAGDVPESIVLENISHPYTHPCILDAKLGQTLHGPDASPEKAARMEKKARASTIKEMGMRWTGCQTWHAPTFSFISTPRSFGYDLTADRLPEGMVRFFPLPTDFLSFIPGDGDKDEASTSSTSAAAAGTAPPSEYTAHAMPPHLTLRVLHALDNEMYKLQTALSHIEMRAVGSSLLVVYEGDVERLAHALDRADANRVRDAARALNEDDGDDDEDDDPDEYPSDLDESDSDTSDDSDDVDGVRADARAARRAPPLSVKLIDFAHTWLVEGDGADTGVLKGLETIRALVGGRMRDVEAWIAQHPDVKRESNTPVAAAAVPTTPTAPAADSAATGTGRPAVVDHTPSSPTAPGRPVLSPTHSPALSPVGATGSAV